MLAENRDLKLTMTKLMDSQVKSHQLRAKVERELQLEKQYHKESLYNNEPLCFHCYCPLRTYGLLRDTIRINSWKVHDEHFILASFETIQEKNHKDYSRAKHCKQGSILAEQHFPLVNVSIWHQFLSSEVRVVFKQPGAGGKMDKLVAYLNESLDDIFKRSTFFDEGSLAFLYLDESCSEMNRVSRFRLLKELICPVSCHPGLRYYVKQPFPCTDSKITAYYPYLVGMERQLHNARIQNHEMDCEMKILIQPFLSGTLDRLYFFKRECSLLNFRECQQATQTFMTVVFQFKEWDFLSPKQRKEETFETYKLKYSSGFAVQVRLIKEFGFENLRSILGDVLMNGYGPEIKMLTKQISASKLEIKVWKLF